MRLPPSWLLAAFPLVIAGCSSSSGGGGDADDSGSTRTGVFVDSAVAGIDYTTATQAGTTNAAGEFDYQAGESVTFSIGDAELPPVAASAQVSPVDIASGSADPDAMTTNIARLLQSLDEDGNPDNGITIPAAAAAAAAALDFSVAAEAFENDPAVINLVANAGAAGTSLISAEDAMAHLNDTLASGDAFANINGLWDRTSDGMGSLLDIDSGAITFYELGATDAGGECYTPSTTSASRVSGSVFDIDGQDENVVFVRVGDNLEVTTDGTSTTNVYPRITDRTAADLMLCNAAAGGADIVLDLRNSTWVDSSPGSGCDGMPNTRNIVYADYTVTAFGDRAETFRDGNCTREQDTLVQDEPFRILSEGFGFLLACGGDAQCTAEEANRSVELPADDPRNDCGSPSTQSISHVVGSDEMRIVACDPDDPEVWVRQ